MAKQKKPDQGPEAVRSMLKKMGIETEPDQVFQFINDALHLPYRPPSPEDSKAAAGFLFELIQAGKYHKAEDREIEKRFRHTLGIKKRSDAKRLDPALVTLDSPEFALVMRKLRGELTPTEVCNEIANIYSVTPRKAQYFIVEIEPHVRKQMKVFDSMLELAKKKQ